MRGREMVVEVVDELQRGRWSEMVDGSRDGGR